MKLYSTILFLSLFNIVNCQTLTKLRAAQTALNSGNYDEAMALFTEIIDNQDSEIKFNAYYGRAYTYYVQKKYVKAKADIKKSLRVKSSNQDYSWIKGSGYWLYSQILCSEKGESRKTLKLLKKSSEYTQSSLLYSTIGFSEIYLKKYNDAIKSLNTSIQLDSNNAWAYSNRALAHLKLEEFNLARADVTKSIEMDNTNPFAFKHSALIYIALKDFESACIELKKAIALNTSGRMSEIGLEEIELLINEHCKTPTKK